MATAADYNATYGSLGGAIVLMLWFYVSGLSVLIGAEMNAEIEHASPHGKDPGEKVPGQRKKLGSLPRGPTKSGSGKVARPPGLRRRPPAHTQRRNRPPRRW